MADTGAQLDTWLLDALPDGPLGVALSGGGDSVALLVLLADWAKARGRTLRAVTVDHGLRPEGADEAARAGALAQSLGIPHATLRWEGETATGNLQDAARRARSRLIAARAAREGLVAVALGHTLDDQAETVIMRLARGSGVDGLSGMAPLSERDGATWVRPLLGVRRKALRDLLNARGVTWAEDPSNDDPRFDRVRVRAALPHLAELGLTPKRLAETATAMGRARRALETETLRLAHIAAAVQPIGTVTLDPDAYAAAEAEIRLRLLAHALGWVGAATYRPRLAALSDLDAALRSGAEGFPRTLHGCLVERAADGIRVLREPARTGPDVPAGNTWDGRWRTSSTVPGLTVAALGEEGLGLVGDTTGHPRAALLASPAFYNDGALFAAPFAKPSKDCHAELNGGTEGFFRALARR